MKKKRYCVAGASLRCFNMYAQPLVTELSDVAELVGLYDINPGRSRYISEHTGGTPVYDDFDTMLAEAKPDAVIVTTVDAYHHEYIIRTLEAGCDVITEKPMTIDAEKVRAVLEAEKRTGKKIYVTHNCRFMPHFVKIKELIMQGAIGRIHNVNYEWNLVYNGHGSSYYHRWNRYLEKSGGLMCHKASHHFDLLNWFVDSMPTDVAAFGALNTYGKNGEQKSDCCRDCPELKTCPVSSPSEGNTFVKEFYFDNEKYDGYQYDSCAFKKDIDAYDTVNLIIRYENGVSASYTFNAAAPFEGPRLVINGSKGRLELNTVEEGVRDLDYMIVRLYDQFGKLTEFHISPDPGSHGGGDTNLRRMIFVGGVDDPLNQMSSSRDGATSVLIGAAANVSIRSNGQMIRLAELLGDPSLLK